MTSEERARRRLLEEFQRTALDRIARINVLWIGLERDPADGAAGDDLLRELHTLKGESRMMGFSDVSLVVHRMEELALSARERAADLPGELGDLLMDASDAAWQLLAAEGGARPPALDLPGLLERFGEVLERFGGAAGAAGAAGAVDEGGVAPRRARPFGAESAPMPEEDFLRIDTARVAAFSETTFELRVRARRMAALARQVSHVLAMRGAQLADLADTARPLAELFGSLQPLCAALAEEAQESEVRLVELDTNVRKFQLVPIASLFERYVRTIRDLARDLGKEVTTKVRVAGVHLDKALIDRLAGAFAHLFRNAIDHGLETGDEREAAGKPRAGCISITAESRGGMVSLTVEDDGRGIDPEAVRARAVELGHVADEESRALEKSDILRFLLYPGVSTRRTVTETSGRGIGLDAVKREVERVGGHVRIRSEVGQGTAIELQLPVSIALTRVLVLRLEDRRYALPSAAISAVRAADASDLEEVHHRTTLREGDERLELVGLGGLLGRPAPVTEPIRAVVVGDEGRRIALAVSGWEEDQDVVVKPLGELLDGARLFSGACLLESGELTLVLNPAVLLALALDRDRERGGAWRLGERAAQAAPRRKSRILFVEDSAVTRSMILYVLTEMGYQVTAARDGKEALEQLADASVDLVLTDLDMPGMDGIELVRQIRAQEAWQGLPVVILSTRSTEADRARAAAAGADDFVHKSEQWRPTLRDALRRQLEPPS